MQTEFSRGLRAASVLLLNSDVGLCHCDCSACGRRAIRVSVLLEQMAAEADRAPRMVQGDLFEEVPA